MISLRMANIMLKFSTLNELFNFILELEAIGGIMPVIPMVMAVPIAVAALGISFQPRWLSKYPPVLLSSKNLLFGESEECIVYKHFSP